MKKFLLTLLIVGLGLHFSASAQSNILSGANISGNFQFDAQTYKQDTLIGADKVSQTVLSNTWFRLNYDLGGFYAAFRYEAYLDPILGYDPRLKGNGFAYRSMGYKNDFIDVVAGNFYGQFGSGLIFRSYEERLLGWDNPLDGAKVTLTPTAGIELTGLVGTMRTYWKQSNGLIRGGDMNVYTNDLFGFMPDDIVWNFGASFVSRYQKDNSSFLKLPENVFAWTGRTSLNYDIFSLNAEYAYKENDPNATNNYSYNPGTALYLTGAVYPKGLGVNFSYHYLDNMDMRTDRDAVGQKLQMNFIPPLSKLYTYRMLTMYPYATQFNGEAGLQLELTTSWLKKLFNDKKNADLMINYSLIKSIDTNHIDKYTYNTNFGTWGDDLFYQEFIVEFDKSWSRKFQTKMLYANQIYNKDVLESEGATKYGNMHIDIVVVEALIKVARRHTLRLDVQHLWSAQDSNFVHSDRRDGNWIFMLAEYSVSPHWFFSIMNEYNYNNPHEDYRLHYPSASFTYCKKATQISFSFGKQRGGLICVGGVCRPVPASNGMRLSVTTSF